MKSHGQPVIRVHRLFKELRNLCVLFRRTSFLSEVFHELKVFLML